MNFCACIGPAGNCPCIREARGEQVEITETHIAPEIFACLPREDQIKINELKRKAFFIWYPKQ